MSSSTIGQLARKAQIPIDTIRYYEKLGLLSPDGRTKSGWRLYGENAERTVRFILKAKDLGFTLSEINSMLSLKTSQTAKCKDMLERVESKMQEAKEALDELICIHAALEGLAGDCPGDDTPVRDCPILHYLDVELNNDD